MTEGAAADGDEARRYVDEVAARAAESASGTDDFADDESTQFGPASAATPTTATTGEVRRHLDEAWAVAGAGTELPADARMRHVKRAVLLAMRPVTSHQVPFNRELAVAVKELAGGLTHLEARIDDGDRAIETTSSRLQAGVATTELTVDHLADTVTDLTAAVDQLLARTARLERDQAADRASIGALRGRQDIVLRAARDALAAGAPAPLDVLANEVDRSAEELSAELLDTIRGTRDEVRAEVEPFVGDVVAVGAAAPVVDLGCGRGEWLEVLRDHGVQAYGIDTGQGFAAAGRDRGLDVRIADAIVHLSTLPESSVAAVTAFHLVERLEADALVDLVDRALRALLPGGVLILAAANPTALDVGAAEFWLDPARRRPVHPQLLELLVLARGFGEAERRWMRPVDPSAVLHEDDFAELGEGGAALLVERLNRVLAGPRGFAVVARKPGAAPAIPDAALPADGALPADTV